MAMDIYNENFVNECVEDVVDRVNNYEGTEAYPCDLRYEITDDENAKGYWNIETECKEILSENLDLFFAIVEDLKFIFGNEYMNDFNPCIDFDKWFCLCMIHLYNIICNVILYAMKIDTVKVTEINESFLKLFAEKAKGIDIYDLF